MTISTQLSRSTRRLLAVALSCVGLLCTQIAPAIGREAEHGTLTVLPPESPGTVAMLWRGVVAAPMAQQIRNVFETHKQKAKRFVLKLESGGGSVAEGERVIDVMRSIKQTHQLDTVVGRGGRCGSMCVFIYVQGQKRFGALSSTWLFHEVSYSDPTTKKVTRLDRQAWERLVDKYFRPAGVSETWIAQMKPYTVQSDYWQTGADLVNEKSGIITSAIGNQQARVVDQPGSRTGAEPPAAKPVKDARSVAAPSECRRYFPSIGAVVSVPCS